MSIHFPKLKAGPALIVTIFVADGIIFIIFLVWLISLVAHRF